MTNKVVLRSTDEFMQDYQPTYQPIYPLFLGNSQAYSEEVGSINFRRMEAVGDIRLKHITPKDTELAQIQVGDGGRRSFKKYFLANQFIQSALQDRSGTEQVVAQVLDEHHKQADELLLFGDGATNGTQKNNGLIFSDDNNHVTKASAAAADLNALHTAIMGSVIQSNQIAGNKIVMFYGADASTRLNGLYTTTPVAFRKVLTDSLPAGSNIIEMPPEIAPAGNGVIIVNTARVKLHYVTMPKLADQGVNDEKMYSWFNFLMGSMMLEVQAKNAVIHQPLTFA